MTYADELREIIRDNEDYQIKESVGLQGYQRALDDVLSIVEKEKAESDEANDVMIRLILKFKELR